MTITHFSIEYDAINSKNTFTNGDTINGRIIVEASKKTKILWLIFKAQGEAHARWSESEGMENVTFYNSQETYYDVEHYFLSGAGDGADVIGPGRHSFPFSFKIPDRKMPSTFTARSGKIVHKLKAELKQSMRKTKKAKTHFTFESKPDMDIPGLMEPQHGCKNKSLKVFGSGNVSVDLYTERMGYKQGEDLRVKVEISNQSSRSVKPKITLFEMKSFFAGDGMTYNTEDIFKEKVEPVAPSSKKTMTKVFTIPKDLPPSITNCSIITLECRLLISLGIKYAFDTVVNLPIVILPASEHQATPQQEAATQPVAPSPHYGAHDVDHLFPDEDRHQITVF